ncbi:MAG: putative oxidoreductase CzcO [Candidatus Erwinia impunctatus]|nr:putative oxidoreductase CzcO [Culicoides impunctatus]
MTTEKINTLVIGAGQAGVAMSEHLSQRNIPHLVLEKQRIAEAWRTGRWDSLVANGPAWHDRFPGMTFPDQSADGFVAKEQVADYFVGYAQHIKAPIRCGVSVTRVTRLQGAPGFHVETSAGVIEAQRVVVATGPFQKPVIPAIASSDSSVLQMHSADYRHPQQLPPGAVLVVGSGSSGVQIADELQRSGRKVFLSVGPHERPPRRYRGRDFCWWLGVLGLWDATHCQPGKEHVTIAVSGAQGGHTVDFRRLAQQGMTLLGSTRACEAQQLYFNDDLAANIRQGDASYLALLDAADAWIEKNGLDLPEEPEARQFPVDPPEFSHPHKQLHTEAEGISTIIWATGYATDYQWLEVDAFQENGRPRHQRGVSSEPGIYFLGLPWLSRRGSSFIWGVWHDASYLADHIMAQNSYLNYQPDTQP